MTKALIISSWLFSIFKHGTIQCAPFGRADANAEPCHPRGPVRGPSRAEETSLLSSPPRLPSSDKHRTVLLVTIELPVTAMSVQYIQGKNSSCKNTDLLQEGQNDLFPEHNYSPSYFPAPLSNAEHIFFPPCKNDRCIMW